MRACPKCGQPFDQAGTVSTDYDGTDQRLAAFALEALERGYHCATWHVYKCRNPECGCGCRQYVPVRAVAVL